MSDHKEVVLTVTVTNRVTEEMAVRTAKTTARQILRNNGAEEPRVVEAEPVDEPDQILYDHATWGIRVGAEVERCSVAHHRLADHFLVREVEG